MEWVPNVAHLHEALELFQQAGSPSAAVQERVRLGVEKLRCLKDGPRYIVTIFAELLNESPQTRQMAGLVLKTHISGTMEIVSLSEDTQVVDVHQIDKNVFEYCKDEVLKALKDPHVEVRNTAGTLITTIVTKYGAETYPKALKLLIELLNETDEDVVSTALETFGKIVEDELRENMSLAPESSVFVNLSNGEIIPRILQFAQPQVKTSLRKRALEILNTYNSHHAFAEGEFAYEFFPQFWTVLGTLAADHTPEIRQPIVTAMVTILDYNIDAVLSHSEAVLSFIITCCSDSNYDVRLAALGFWTVALKDEATHNLIRPFLSRLLPCLVENSLYSKWDYMQMDQSQLEQDSTVADENKNLEPRFHQSRGAEPDEDGDEDEEELSKSAWGSSWSVRKAAALALDNGGRVFKGEILPFVLPLIEVRLQHTDWEIRESGVLALGAITRGCLKDLWPYVPNVLKLLITLCDDSMPLLRSICCWCLNRFAEWYCAPGNRDEFLPIVIRKLLDRLLDRNKFVQEAACSAFASLEEEARTSLLPFMRDIARAFGHAFATYQTKNLFILYDAVGTLAECIKEQLIEEPHRMSVQAYIIEPLFLKWNQCQIQDYTLIALCEAVGCTVNAMQKHIAPFAPLIVSKAHELLGAVVKMTNDLRNNPSGDEPRPDAISSIFDLLSYLIEAIGPEIEKIITQYNFTGLLEHILVDPKFSLNIGLSQALFALLGDMSKNTPTLLEPHLPVIVPKLAASLSAKSWAVSSNASWAIGQIAEQSGRQGICPHEGFVIQQLVKLVNSRFYNKPLRHNACITMGRLGSVFPEVLAVHLHLILASWCSIMKDSRTLNEKEKSFKGICLALHQNPQAASGTAIIVPLLECIASFYLVDKGSPTVPPPPPVGSSNGTTPAGSPSSVQYIAEYSSANVSEEIDVLNKRLVSWLHQNCANDLGNAFSSLQPDVRKFLQLSFIPQCQNVAWQFQ